MTRIAGVHHRQLSHRVAGVVALRPKNSSPITDYYALLSINEAFADRIADIQGLVAADKVVHYNMRPDPPEGRYLPT